MTMDRRAFLYWGATRAGFVALLALGGAAALLGPSAIARQLRETFPYLDVTDEDLERFATAYVQTYGRPAPGDQATVEDTFLLSTDFFTNGADESAPVRYVALYGPYVTPCLNPLARFDT